MRRLPLLVTALLSILLGVLCATGKSVEATAVYGCPDLSGAVDRVIVDTSCFYYFQTAKTWANAKTACAAYSGGKLATIRSSAANAAIYSLIRGNTVWLGGADDNSLITGSSEGTFYWIGDSSAFWTGGSVGAAVGGAYANWYTGEPNDQFGEDCAQMYGWASGGWNDSACSNSNQYVCEIPATDLTTLSSSSSSSDGDTTTGTGGGRRQATMDARINNAVQNRSTRGSHPAAPSSVSMVSTNVNIAPMCARMRYATASPAARKQINDSMMKRYKQTCR